MTLSNQTKNSLGRRTALSAGILIVFAALLLLLSFWLRRPVSRNLSGELFRLNGGATPCYDDAGNGLAVATSTGIHLFSGRGKCVAEAEVALLSPACSACASCGVYYDVGATGFWLLHPDGKVEYHPTDDAVTYAHVNEEGMLVVLTEGSEYKGHMYVYDSDGQALFRWDRGSGYPLTGRLSADGLLCVNCVTASGSVLRFFRTDVQEELFSYSAPGELIVDFGFLSDGTIAAVLEDRLVFLRDNGEERFSYSFSGQYLTAFSIDGPYAIAATSASLTGENASLFVLNSHGRVLGTLDTEHTVLSLSTREDRLLILFEDEATLYTAEMKEIVSVQNTLDEKQVFLCPDGTAILAGTEGARLVDFGQ